MAVMLRYELREAGWADCTVQIGEQRITVSASYLSNALDDLAAAVVALLRGESSATATFAEEPGEFRWQFDRQDNDQVRVRIYWSIPRWKEQLHDPATPIFDGVCPSRTFAEQLVAELQRLLRKYGVSGYRDRWVLHNFPSKRLEQLQALLADSAEGPLTSA